MWTIEIGQIGQKEGDPSTRTLSSQTVEDRPAAQAIAIEQLTKRGVSRSDAEGIAAMAGVSWCDDFPTHTAVRIFER
ncbi:hypothetical protein [Mycobacteroides abscessus]|uniref:hypothetical protein n=1 Tax=Mycobacteroides abscessus TaxID=36809 RepID=UPI000C260744|nr:hypothetical protein [Mycobacteroides abscessus]